MANREAVTIPANWNASDLLIHINRVIVPEGRIMLRSKTAKERCELGEYYVYEWWCDGAGEETHINLADYWLDLVKQGKEVVLFEDVSVGNDEAANRALVKRAVLASTPFKRK
jgi:hypothetical protein